jgi:competence protein ComEC
LSKAGDSKHAHAWQLVSALTLVFVIWVISPLLAKKRSSLQIYFIDVEGGQATLIVSPAGQSLLIDTGWPGFDGRDSDRILAAARLAGVEQLDYVLITHYHRDHVGGVVQLVDRIKVGTFVDHGPNLEDSDVTRQDYAAYQKVLPRAKHLVLGPGDGLPMNGITIRTLTAAGEHITDPLPGAGEANPYCTSDPAPPDDPTENARSLGILLTYGKFRMIDLGDLTKKKELALVCPNNRVGVVDLYVVTHHGFDRSNARSIVWALHPRVAIMDNGSHKGASQQAWQTVHDSPGLEGFWQLHYAIDAGTDHNVKEEFIANVDDKPDGNYIKVMAQADGSFVVTNSRTNHRKNYE